MTIIKKTTFLTLILLIIFSAGCRPKKPPIILIIIDTLRYDHVGAYGYERKITPALDNFAKEAMRFDNAHAAASWTVPSMASMFTGVYPWDHGVVAAEVGDATVRSQQVLSEQFVTLAESLKKAGYATWGVSANYHLHQQYGMGQGFDHYQVFGFRQRKPVDQQLETWLPLIKKQWSRGKPYFLFVHYFDAHHPYLPINPFIDQIHPNLNLDEADQYGKRDLMENYKNNFYLKHPDKMQLLIDLYDSEVMSDDESVGELLEKLPGSDEAVVVITADHGEAFGDHQNMLHGIDLYGETLQVPLLIRLPHQQHAGAASQDLVSLIDLYPTLTAVAGAANPKYLRGLDLNTLWSGASKAKDRFIFAMTERQEEGHWRAVLGSRYKLLELEKPRAWELYDRRADPKEKTNLYQEKPDLAAEYRKILDQARPAKLIHNPGVTGKPIDNDLRNQLKDLGYL